MNFQKKSKVKKIIGVLIGILLLGVLYYLVFVKKIISLLVYHPRIIK